MNSTERKAKPFFDKIKAVSSRKFVPRQANIKDTSGITLLGDEALDRWREYGATLYAKPAGEVPLTKAQYAEIEPLPLVAVVEAATRQLKNGKAPGKDGVPAELIKMAGPAGLLLLHRLICRIWNTCIWPSDWKTRNLFRFLKLVHAWSAPTTVLSR